MEKPGTSLDFVLRKGVKLGGQELKFSFAARNLLETEHSEFQQAGGQRIDVYTYQPGISYDLSLSVEF